MILAILQARCSSTRLPGKVLLPLLGEPMIRRQLERIRRSQEIDRVVVATSTDRSDDQIDALCASNGIEVFRGSLNDVLDRFYQAARPLAPAYVVRLTADCPLADAAVIDGVIRFCISGGYDYASNTVEPTFPDGLDVEVLRAECLAQAWREARLPSEREHVTPFLYRHPERFRIGQVKADRDLSNLRWTVDEEADYRLVTQIYAELYPSNPNFTTADVLALLERRPELRTLNITIPRNEGMKKSLAADAAYLSNRK